MKVRNTPLPASWLKNATPGPLPPPCGCGAATRRAIPMSTGNTAVTASSSRFRLRAKTSRSSAANSRSQARAAEGGTDAAGAAGAGPGSAGPGSAGPGSGGPGSGGPAGAAASAVDIEALPGEPDEQVLQAGRGHREAADPDPGVDELGADPFRLGVAQRGRGFVRPGLGAGEAQAGEHLDRALGVGGLHDDPGGTGPAEFGQRALEDQPAGTHYPDVGADLLDLGQQVRGDEHGGAVGGDLPDQRAYLPGPLRVEAVGRLVEDDELARPQQAGRDGQPLFHAERVVAVPLPGRGPQAHPVQRRS